MRAPPRIRWAGNGRRAPAASAHTFWTPPRSPHCWPSTSWRSRCCARHSLTRAVSRMPTPTLGSSGSWPDPMDTSRGRRPGCAAPPPGGSRRGWPTGGGARWRARQCSRSLRWSDSSASPRSSSPTGRVCTAARCPSFMWGASTRPAGWPRRAPPSSSRPGTRCSSRAPPPATSPPRQPTVSCGRRSCSTIPGSRCATSTRWSSCASARS
mmetsp:Transcript_32143/g.103793  ORF Transcript_32143/g.103793 Transcript_32143/m.103793 type:complete len:210 (-) Transcript_32143:416-1045(-)